MTRRFDMANSGKWTCVPKSPSIALTCRWSINVNFARSCALLKSDVFRVKINCGDTTNATWATTLKSVRFVHTVHIGKIMSRPGFYYQLLKWCFIQLKLYYYGRVRGSSTGFKRPFLYLFLSLNPRCQRHIKHHHLKRMLKKLHGAHPADLVSAGPSESGASSSTTPCVPSPRTLQLLIEHTQRNLHNLHKALQIQQVQNPQLNAQTSILNCDK